MTCMFTYDAESGAMYVRLREGCYHESIEISEGCYLDVTDDGMVLGLECLSLNEFRELIERGGGKLELPERVEDPDRRVAELAKPT